MSSITYRIHGDNIIECERIINYIKTNIDIIEETRKFISHAVIQYDISFTYNGNKYDWEIELFPGFNKKNRARWGYNIFEKLKEEGSFLDETPDAILTKVENDTETVVLAIEFCSALQAGNQAWQRSGRAFSTAKIGVPYIYIVDFVRYELKSNRSRSNLRFPNPAVPFSYINHSKNEDVFIVQAYVKSEEFDMSNTSLRGFDQSIFSEKEISDYIIGSLLELDLKNLEQILLNKNERLVEFLSPANKKIKVKRELTKDDWRNIYNNDLDVVEFSKHEQLPFRKTISDKSLSKHSKTRIFNDIVTKYAYGIASTGLPFGVIDKNDRKNFITEVSNHYDLKDDIFHKLSSSDMDLIVCLVKGFKPRGDDNRPDRGILPFGAMLTSEKYEVLSYIYGPMTEKNINKFSNDYKKLVDENGFWNVFMSMSDYIMLDVPVIHKDKNYKETISSQNFKNQQLKKLDRAPITFKKISPEPNSVHEDDVDSAIHTLFTSLPSSICFEGSCNPPGGDWSGISIKYDGDIYRWLSLPRVSHSKGKRPDHILEFSFDTDEKPTLLIIESKDYPKDLEKNVGKNLITYVTDLMKFPSSAILTNNDWKVVNDKSVLKQEDFNFLSAGVYIYNSGDNIPAGLFTKTNCDIMFALSPVKNNNGILWNLKIQTTKTGKVFLKKLLNTDIIDIAKSIGISIQ